MRAATLNGALRAAAEEFAQRYADRPEASGEEITTCVVRAGGTVRAGDTAEVEVPPPPHRTLERV